MPTTAPMLQLRVPIKYSVLQ